VHLQIYLLPLAGLIIGLLISLMGGGGGIFYVSILTGLFSISMNQAVPISLATIIPTTLAAAVSHYRMGNVKPKAAMLLVSGGIFGVAAGSYLATIIPVRILKIFFGIFLLLMGTKMLISSKKRGTKSDAQETRISSGHSKDETVQSSKVITAKGLGYGLLGGLMSGMLGVSGTPPILAGLYSLDLSSIQVVGTSTMVLFFIACAGVFTHSAFGTMDWNLVLLLASGTITGAIVGPLLGRRISTKILNKFYEPFFIVFILLMAISMFF